MKKTKSWSIDEEVAERFETYCNEHGMVQNHQVEKMIEAWLNERKG